MVSYGMTTSDECHEEECTYGGLWTNLRCVDAVVTPEGGPFITGEIYLGDDCTDERIGVYYLAHGACVWMAGNEYATFTCDSSGSFVTQRTCYDSACALCSETEPVPVNTCYAQYNGIFKCPAMDAAEESSDGSGYEGWKIAVAVIVVVVVLALAGGLIYYWRRSRQAYSTLTD